MASLDALGKGLVRDSWAPRTWRTMEVGVKSFHDFLEKCDICDIGRKAANPDDIVRYIAFLTIQRKAPSTINTYVSAISTWHKRHRYADPCDDYDVKRAVKGVAKAGRKPDSRAPITIALLGKLINALKYVCSSDYENSMFKCAFLMAFFGLFRIGELVCDSNKKAQRSAMTLDDVHIKKNHMKLRIRYSKTDQTGKSCEITIQGSDNEKLCPVYATKCFIAQRGQYAGPLFSHFNQTYLSRFQFNAILKSAMNFVVPEITNVKSHSFRIGGATNAVCKGIPYEVIKAMGRWKSDAAKRYIRMPIIKVSDLT